MKILKMENNKQETKRLLKNIDCKTCIHNRYGYCILDVALKDRINGEYCFQYDSREWIMKLANKLSF